MTKSTINKEITQEAMDAPVDDDQDPNNMLSFTKYSPKDVF